MFRELSTDFLNCSPQTNFVIFEACFKSTIVSPKIVSKKEDFQIKEKEVEEPKTFRNIVDSNLS